MRKLGGWTRVWVVISCTAVCAGGWTAYDGYSRAVAYADAVYQEGLAAAKLCGPPGVAARPALPNSPMIDVFPEYFHCGRDSISQWQARRDEYVRNGTRTALVSALHVGVWPPLFVGVLFIAIGWIRSGFRFSKNNK
ncbi:hypothetical protein PAP18089_04112 [Pandoraea apista]|uniref:Transmembrane protein n=1 Tax=Pandoraea apista TaxID=93218 RepID=A0A5E5PBU5_9BURK|nr:hypothetical protein PAP18089_04112 [Pandoraea apista]